MEWLAGDESTANSDWDLVKWLRKLSSYPLVVSLPIAAVYSGGMAERCDAANE
jgi:hypothetical protein